MWKQNNFETLWQEEANLWIKKYLIITEFNSCIMSQHSFIHQRHTFWKGSLFLKLKFLRISQALSCKHFGQTSSCYYYRQQTQWSRREHGPESQVASRKSDVTRHDDVTISVTRPLCHDDAMRIPEGSRRPGVVWWLSAENPWRDHKKGSLKN